MRIYLTCFLLISSLMVKAGQNKESATDTAMITVHLAKQNVIRLTYYDRFLLRKDLIFRSSSDRDTIITKKIFVKNITELRYSLNNNAINKAYFTVFYVKGGDRIALKLEDFKIKNLTSNPYLFVSDFLTIDDSIFALSEEGGPSERIAANKKTYDDNLSKVDSLAKNGKIADSVARLWKEISHNFYMLKNMRMRYSRTPYLDTLVTELKQLVSNEKQLNNTYLNAAIYSIGNYNKVKNGLNHNLKFFIEEVLKIKTNNSFKAGVVFQELYNFPEKTSKLYEECYRLFVNEFKDPLFMAESYYASVNPSLLKVDKTSIKLISYQKEELTLADVFKKHKGKLIVFDFWASWCLPCIAEFPALEKIKAELSDKKIAFVTISLDKDEKDKYWKNALISAKIKAVDQFRVLGKSNQLISTLYKIDLIPRYLIFDKKGMLINDHFMKPSDPSFGNKLLTYLD